MFYTVTGHKAKRSAVSQSAILETEVVCIEKIWLIIQNFWGKNANRPRNPAKTESRGRKQEGRTWYAGN